MRAGIIVAAAITCACATTTSAIHPDDRLDPSLAYLYGRFFIRVDQQPGTLASRQSIGLQLRCTDYHEYTIWFSHSRDIQVLKVHPSRCALVSGTLTDDDGIGRRRINVEPADMITHEFASGKAYYLGDYFARGVFEQSMHPGFTLNFWGWAMDPADDRYESTTAEMQRTFRNIAPLPTADKRIIPPKPAPKRGAVVITDPKEPPMSPERIAHVAPFIKRTFASPSACEAACPTGQCLPFRGEGGPAMACIVRCNSDKDCPEGLACNCPSGDKPGGPDCYQIATTSADRMGHICLSVEAAGQRR